MNCSGSETGPVCPDFLHMSLSDTDREVLQEAIRCLDLGLEVALVTVVKTWGSSPRPKGSLLIMRKDGHFQGSVSGGCVETDLVQRYGRGELSGPFPTLINYGVNREDAVRFGLPCGGRLELVVEILQSAAQLRILLDKVEAGEQVARRLCLHTGEISLHRPTAAEFHYSDNEVVKVFGPGWQLLLIGAGQLSQYTAAIAIMLGYEVCVCDPRDEADEWDMAGVSLIKLMPDDAVNQLSVHGRSLLLALTHDPKLDDMALMNALSLDLFYVGALGSHRSSEQRRERLLQLGVTPEQLQRLHAPVGLPIGSHTPPEIAVAIMAQITALRNSVVL